MDDVNKDAPFKVGDFVKCIATFQSSLFCPEEPLIRDKIYCILKVERKYNDYIIRLKDSRTKFGWSANRFILCNPKTPKGNTKHVSI